MPPQSTASATTCARVRGRRETASMARLNTVVDPRIRLSTRISVICIVKPNNIQRPL